LAWFLAASEQEIMNYAEIMDVSTEQLVEDIMWLAEYFGFLDDAVDDVTETVEEATWRFQHLADNIRDVLASIQEQIDKATFLGANGSEAGYYKTKMMDVKALLEGAISEGETEAAMQYLAEGAAYLQSWYNAAVAEATKIAQDALDAERESLQNDKDLLNEQLNVARAFGSLVDQIDSVIESIESSYLNVALPSEKAAMARADYDTLLAKAKSTGTVEDYQNFVSFAQTALEQYQERYKSSPEYQSFYSKVMGDLETAKSYAEAQSYEEAILSQLETIDDSINNLELNVDLTAVNDMFAYLSGEINKYIERIQEVDLAINIDWASADVEDIIKSLLTLAQNAGWDSPVVIAFIAEIGEHLANFDDAMEVLKYIAGQTGWNSIATITFIENMGSTIGTFSNAMKVLDYIAGQTGWDSTATITMVATIANEIKDITTATAMLDYLLENAGGWDSDAVIKFLAEIDTTSFATATDQLNMLYNISKASGGWTTDATMAFLANLSDDGTVTWAQIDAYLTSHDASNAIKATYQAIYDGANSAWNDLESFNTFINGLNLPEAIVANLQSAYDETGGLSKSNFEKIVAAAGYSEEDILQMYATVDANMVFSDTEVFLTQVALLAAIAQNTARMALLFTGGSVTTNNVAEMLGSTISSKILGQLEMSDVWGGGNWNPGYTWNPVTFGGTGGLPANAFTSTGYLKVTEGDELFRIFPSQKSGAWFWTKNRADGTLHTIVDQMPSGTSSNSMEVTQATAANLKAEVWQTTPANLKVEVATLPTISGDVTVKNNAAKDAILVATAQNTMLAINGTVSLSKGWFSLFASMNNYLGAMFTIMNSEAVADNQIDLGARGFYYQGYDKLGREVYPTLGQIPLPGEGFASGGISMGPDSGHMELLHGNEAVIPLANGAVPVRMLNGGSAGPPINLTVQIAGKEFEGEVKAWADDVVVMRAKKGKLSDTRRMRF
jgi:hypothetical protein